MIARAGGDDAARALVARKRCDQIEAAAHLECAGRIVILVFDVDIEPGFGGEKRMAYLRCAAHHASDSRARAIEIVECERNHVQYYRRVRAANSRISLGMRSAPPASV